MSILMGALGGLGDAAQRMGEANQKLWGEEELTRLRGDIDQQKAQALAEFKANLDIKTVDQQRTVQQGRIDEAARPIVQQALDGKYAGAKPADASTWTAEQQAAVDQSRGIDEQALLRDPKVRRQAAEQTGDISPEKAATLSNSAEINQIRMDSLLERAADKNATAKEIADIRSEATTAAAQLRVDAANQRASAGKIDTATGRMLITSEDVNIKAATSQIATLNRELVSLDPQVKGPDGKRVPNPAIASIKEQMDGLRADIKTSQENKASYLKTMGLMDGGAPTEKAVKDAGEADKPKKPASAAEEDLKPKVNSPMGTNVGIIDENIRQIQAALATTKDARAKTDLESQLEDYKRQRLRLDPAGGSSATRPPLSAFLK